jgi:hypothetical protein
MLEGATERSLGHVLALVGGVLIGLGAIVAFLFGSAELLIGHLMMGVGAIAEAFVLLVMAALVLVFAHLGEHAWKDKPGTNGLILVVLALVGWIGLGVGSNVVSLVGALLVVLAGVLYLIGPTHRVAASVARSVSAG